MGNVLGDAIDSAEQLMRQEIFKAVVVAQSAAGVVVRRPASTQEEGPYPTLGTQPAVGSIVSVQRVGVGHVVLTHREHSATMFIPGTAMQPDGGVFAATNGSHGPYGVQEVNGVISGAFFSFRSTAKNPTYTVVFWVSASESSKSIVFEHRYGTYPPIGSALTNNFTETVTPAQDYTSGHVYEVELESALDDPVDVGDLVWGNILRLGGNAGDTYTGNVIILGLKIN